MLIVRSLRPDRVSFCATSFIINNLGSKFVEPPVLDMQQVVEDSTTRTPLIFVLSAGVVCHVYDNYCFNKFSKVHLYDHEMNLQIHLMLGDHWYEVHAHVILTVC